MKNNTYNHLDKNSIIAHAKKLKNKTLRQACSSEIVNHKFKGNGVFGQLLEKFYFDYEPNSDSNPDFNEAQIELKSSGLKILKNKEYRIRYRLVLNIINYEKVYKEKFKTSSFWKKNAHLLIVFYLHDKDKEKIDYEIKLIGDWKIPELDLKQIEKDWAAINLKISNGKAHEISEGDTFYLGACTKGGTAATSYRNQPFNKEQAKQRAYCFKGGYFNHILATIADKENTVYGRIIKNEDEFSENQTIEEIVEQKFKPFYNKTPKEIEKYFKLELNSKSKNYYATLTKKILGLELNQKIEEFEKADIQTKTVRLKENNLPDQHISFPIFKYIDLTNRTWDNSYFKETLEQKFFFVFYQFVNKKLILKTVKFWNMPVSDVKDVETVWNKTKEVVMQGTIVKAVKNGRRLTYFPKSTEHRISHVRPHATDRFKNVNPLPQKDVLTKVSEYTDHSFWLNAKYIRDEIFLK